jgi:hypothetical protein
MRVTTLGLNLAKNVFQVHGVTATGEVAVSRTLRRRDWPGIEAQALAKGVIWSAKKLD